MVYRRAKKKTLINVYMTFEIVFVLLSLLGMVAALVADKMRPGMILFSVVVLFLCAGILTPKEMLEGFSNKGMITVALLFLVSEGIRHCFHRARRRCLKHSCVSYLRWLSFPLS